ncbi:MULTISPECIES: Urease operon accessory protein [unclassified Phyllobacterium]|uniref:Urease operon accessory protein n=1 Tax=unclassified Phyllobacterium TaxID=2638441 RepID=UPI003012EE93
MIIGNGTVDERHARTIDAADFVIRFNDCRSYVTSGTRTDVVAVCNTGRPAKAMLESLEWHNHPAVIGATEIWCVRGGAKFAAMRPFINILHPELWDLCDDKTQDFHRFCADTGKKCVEIGLAIHEWVDGALQAFDPAPYIAPSSGMIVIASVLQLFPSAMTTIAGFSHVGWKHHPFVAERQLIDSYVGAGKLVRL